jgi:hypothetical protein
MRSKRLILLGDYVEAYPYFDFIWLIAASGSIMAFDVTAYCQKRLNGSGSAAVKIFADNQRIHGNPDPQVEILLDSASPIEVSSEDVEKFSYIFETTLNFRSVLDLRFYYGRAYIGLDASIRQFAARGREDLDQSHLGRTATQTLGEMLVSDVPAREFQCRYGAVGAACGKEGGWIGIGANDTEPSWRIQLKKFAASSFSLEFNGDAVSNLSEARRIDLYSSSIHRKIKDDSRKWPTIEEHELLELESVGSRAFASQTSALNNFIGRNKPTERVFLFKSTVWSITSSGVVRLRMAERDRMLSTPSEWRIADAPPDRVLSTATTESGVLAECDERVFILHKEKWTEIISEPVYSVRGYLTSKRYRNVVTAVMLDRVELIAIFRDEQPV